MTASLPQLSISRSELMAPGVAVCACHPLLVQALVHNGAELVTMVHRWFPLPDNGG